MQQLRRPQKLTLARLGPLRARQRARWPGLAVVCLLLAFAAVAGSSDGQPQTGRSLQQQLNQQQAQLAALVQQGVPHRHQPAASPQAAGASAPGAFLIPRPPPGSDTPAEPLVPLYSPDQLRVRHKIIPGIPLDSQVISLLEQVQQARALNATLSREQMDSAQPLLGAHGRVAVPHRTGPAEYEHGYLALCVIVRDQGADLREWLEYHRHLGVRKAYVYDNNSTVPLAGELAGFMQAGFVEYAYFAGMPRYRDLFRTSSQWWAYNDCISRYRHRHRWLGFIDADEFIVLHPGANASDLNEFMTRYEPYGGLALNWVIFGSSGHKARPKGGVLVNYRACLPFEHEQNQHVKIIANTRHLLSVGDDPHRAYYTDAAVTVDELGRPVLNAWTEPSHSRVALYHYLTKSEGEYMQKMARGSAAGNYKSPEFFATIDSMATANCTRAVPLGLACCPSVREDLGPEGVARVQAQIAADAAAEARVQAAKAAAAPAAQQQQQQQQSPAAAAGGPVPK